ncbi:hypothetical protein HDU97_004366 [Phlyctochytrium planicorne]|nr:hypothetical protein HDU97_004366 [Phlyctochytrium planicorne]
MMNMLIPSPASSATLYSPSVYSPSPITLGQAPAMSPAFVSMPLPPPQQQHPGMTYGSIPGPAVLMGNGASPQTDFLRPVGPMGMMVGANGSVTALPPPSLAQQQQPQQQAQMAGALRPPPVPVSAPAPAAANNQPITPLRHRAVLQAAASEVGVSAGVAGSKAKASAAYNAKHHRLSDQRRREEMKVCFNNLMTVLPNGPVGGGVNVGPVGGGDEDDEDDEDPVSPSASGEQKQGKGAKPPNRVEIMGRTLDYIISLKGRVGKLEGTVDGLRAELARLKIEKGVVGTGGPKGGVLRVGEGL